MGFESCSLCGKLFDKKKSDLCPACDEIESLNLKKITNFLQAYEKLENKSFSLKALSSATGVKIQDIERLYRSNKLRSYTGLISLDCKLCGNKFRPTIFSGVFCKKCTNKVEKVVKELKESDMFVEKEFIPVKPKEVIKPKEKEEIVQKSGMHMKEDSRRRCGFKKN